MYTDRVYDWIKGRKTEWNLHIEIMADDKLVRVEGDKTPEEQEVAPNGVTI